LPVKVTRTIKHEPRGRQLEPFPLAQRVATNYECIHACTSAQICFSYAPHRTLFVVRAVHIAM